MSRTIKILIVVQILLVISSCMLEPGETSLDIYFTRQPTGGNNQQMASANIMTELTYFEATGVGNFDDPGADEIEITVEWWSESALPFDETLMSTEKIRITEEGEQELTVAYDAGDGFVVNNYWWVKIFWEDSYDSYELESEQGFYTNN